MEYLDALFGRKTAESRTPLQKRRIGQTILWLS